MCLYVYIEVIVYIKRFIERRRNAFFQIIQKKDGMYLKSYPEVEGGKKLTMEDILDYIDKKNLRDIETGNVKQFVEKANADETGSVEVKVLEGNHLPEICNYFYGQKWILCKNQVISAIRQRGKTFGFRIEKSDRAAWNQIWFY